MHFFETRVDLRSRGSMELFLKQHFRYFTGNSWNGSSSYAHCVKLHSLGLLHADQELAWKVLDTDNYWHRVRSPIDAFTDRCHGDFTIGTNGRSGGYLVLYSSKRRHSEYKSYCPDCGQRNYTVKETGSGLCGVCRGERVNYDQPLVELSVSPFRGIDYGVDFVEWPVADLKNRTRLVRDFDRTCDQIRDRFIRLIRTCKVVERNIYIPQRSRQVVCATRR